MSYLIGSLAGLCLAITAMTFSGLLINQNAAQQLERLVRDTAVLRFNVTDAQNRIPATVACQAMLPDFRAAYLECIARQNLVCSTTAMRELALSAKLAVSNVANLTNMQTQVQASCANRTALVAAAAASLVALNTTTLLMNGTATVTVQGSLGPFTSAFTVWRIVLGGEFKLDYVVLPPWLGSIATATLNPTVTYVGAGLPCGSGAKPMYGNPFTGGTVVSHAESCGSMVFQVRGSVAGGGLRLASDFTWFY